MRQAKAGGARGASANFGNIERIHQRDDGGAENAASSNA